MGDAYTFFLPQNITVGAGSIAKIGEVAAKLHSKKAFIITGNSMVRHGVVSHVSDLLFEHSIVSEHFSDIEPNPSVSTVERCTDAFIASKADLIIALGGGSPMDVAKAVAVVAKYGGSITDYEGADKLPGDTIPMIAVPTTAGTGSEVTAFSVITDHARDYKFTVFSYKLLPAYAILDPELITTLPKSVAAACGMDALIHAIESEISLAANPFSEAMSEKAIALIGSAILAYVEDRTDLMAAESMITGSLFAGIAFSFARLGNVHAMSHPISALYDVPHGVANAVLLPYVMEYNATADAGKYQKIYELLTGETFVGEFDPMILVEKIRELCKKLEIPETISAAVSHQPKFAGITREEILDHIPFMTEDAMKSGNIQVNPRRTTAEDILKLYKTAL